MELKVASQNILDQLKRVIQEISLTDFTEQIAVLNQSTIGQHVRHTLEFFICLIDGISTGNVNYDKRGHNKTMEQDKELAVRYIKDIQNRISTLQEEQILNVEVNYGLDGETNKVIPTNIARELAYNIEHAVHHMAIIKIGVQSIRTDIVLPRDFGVAVSTIRYQEIAEISK